MIIDSHQHFWRMETGLYGWIPPADTMLRRDFVPEHLAPHLAAAGISGTVLVQAANVEAELTELSAHARAAGFVRGIVGPLEVTRPGVADRIQAMAKTPLLVGFRPPFRDVFDSDGSVSDLALAALDAMGRHGLAFDCLAAGPLLAQIPSLAQVAEAVTFVVDHGGNPDLAQEHVGDDWQAAMAAIAACPNIVCKLSGLLTRRPGGADAALIAQHVAILLDLFGPDRLLWGSDWPVLTKVADLGHWLDMCQELIAPLSRPERDAILGANAMRVYRLEARDDAAA